MNSFSVHQLLESEYSDTDTSSSFNSPPSSPKPESIDESKHRESMRVSSYYSVDSLN